MKSKKLTLYLFVSLVFLSCASLFIGVVEINVDELITSPEKLKILILARIPRLLAIICTGVGMSVAGLIMQQICKNKFVSPSTAATISSAQLGLLISMIFINQKTLLMQTLFAAVFSIIGTCFFIFLIQKFKFKEIMLVPLIGIMFGNIIGGITNLIAYKYGLTQTLQSWLTGSFSDVIKGRYEIVWLVIPMVIVAFVFANYFNIVGMGEDFAQNLGINYNVVLFLGLSICSLITASIVVVVGSISFVGLIVPNILTMLKGDKIKNNLIDVSLVGALFVLSCDLIARIIIFPYELPIELVIGIIGTCFFIIFLMLKINNKGVK